MYNFKTTFVSLFLLFCLVSAVYAATPAPQVISVIPQTTTFTQGGVVFINGSNFENYKDNIKVFVTPVTTIGEIKKEESEMKALNIIKLYDNTIQVALPEDVSGKATLRVNVGQTESKIFEINISKKDSKTTNLFFPFDSKIERWFRMFGTRPITFSLEGYYTDTLTKIDTNDNLTQSSSGEFHGNASFTYNLQFSSFYYVLAKDPRDTPAYYMKNLQIYFTGSYGNAITVPDSTLNFSTTNTFTYKTGIKFSATMDEIIYNGDIPKFKY